MCCKIYLRKLVIPLAAGLTPIDNPTNFRLAIQVDCYDDRVMSSHLCDIHVIVELFKGSDVLIRTHER
jgi:hypothetical protein